MGFRGAQPQPHQGPALPEKEEEGGQELPARPCPPACPCHGLLKPGIRQPPQNVGLAARWAFNQAERQRAIWLRAHAKFVDEAERSRQFRARQKALDKKKKNLEEEEVVCLS